MRALLPELIDDVDVHQHYASGWLADGGVRVNFISSLDGAASAAGLSEGLQTAGDNEVFAALRDLADVVVAGARTALAEGYQPIELSAARVERRRALGLSADLPTAIMSRSLHLDPAAPLFTQARPQAPTIVITCSDSDPERRAELAAVADVVECGEHQVDLATALDALRARGLSRILCEGGPTLFAALADDNLVDDVCLTVSPILTGPGAPRIVAGPAWVTPPRRRELIGLLEEDSALFLRLGRQRRPPS